MIYELNHFGIYAEDAEKTLAFYEKLDAKIVFDRTIAGPDVRVLYLQIAGSMLEFICHPNPPAGWEYGIDHLAFMSDDLDGDYARLLAAGCSEAEAPKPAGTGVGRLAFVTRDGARIELLQRDVDFRQPFDGSGIIAGFDHYAYTVGVLGEATAFFTEVVGMETVAELSAGGTPIRRFLGLKGDALGLGEPHSARSGGAFPYFTLRVDDVDATLAELRARGLDGVGESEASRSGIGRSAFLEAPDGVRIELLDRPALSPTLYTDSDEGALVSAP